MDSFLITLVVIAIAALSNWLQHRAQARDEAPPDRTPQPPVPTPPRSRRATPPHLGEPRPQSEPRRPETDWEEVVRRFLGGEPPAPPPRTGPPRTAPPVSRPAPPPMQGPIPPPPVRPVVAVPPPAPTYSPPAAPVLERLREHESAYSKAHQLHESVAQRLRDVHRSGTGPKPKRTPIPGQPRHRLKADSLWIHQIRDDPAAAKRAFVASLVFGQPKGFE